MNEDLVELQGGDGLRRWGVLCMPKNWSGVSLVLVPAGLKYQVGPNRLYVLLARRLASAGHAVLRFDPAGWGESEGSLATMPVRQWWSAIEHGYLVQETVLAAQWLRKRYAPRAILVGGLCGGAISAQLAAVGAPALFDGVVSIAAPVRLSDVEPEDSRVHPHVARVHLCSYLSKLRSMEAWGRLIGGSSSFDNIRATLQAVLSGWLRRKLPVSLPNQNPLFLASFSQLQGRGTPQLLLFGAKDNRWLEFQAGILEPRLQGRMHGEHYEIRVIRDANHELHFRGWKEEAITHVQNWVHLNFFRVC